MSRDDCEIRLLGSLAEVSARSWDALVDPSDPFSEHAFLLALEQSGAVGAEAGWLPLHLALFENDVLAAALPLYIKDHSYGEFIFDWSWAHAAARNGMRYYPKLVSMTPFTPVVSPSFLLDAERVAARGFYVETLTQAALSVASQQGLSSLHLLFVDDRERSLIPSPMMKRTTMQFHWHNQGYRDFEDYLTNFRASARKSTRRERREAKASGLRIEEKEGDAIDARDWRALERFYRCTCDAHGSPQYLPPGFFRRLAENGGQRAVAILAYDGEEAVAGTLNFEKGKKLYGRYWGADVDVPFLHFELAYYRLIERAIRLGLETVEAGAQGMHKLKRGFMPSPIYSAHWLADPLLRGGVERFLREEQHHTGVQIAQLAPHGPFRRGQPQDENA